MSSRLAKLAISAFLVVNCIVWAQSRRAIAASHSPSYVANLLGKRSGLDVELECVPLSFPVDQQCAHVREACPETDTFLNFPHLQAYFCASPALRPAVFVGLLIWLALLFSVLGIGASDFFCPNLATIATVLGLDENVAGVTFLAVGNGSPDVFSTFSAMKSQSGSLAVGELLGAASFIVSVVVGSMCIIKPFHVNRGPFLRDVGFFTVAVALLLWILHDGKLHAWEAGTLVGLYVVYVAAVVVGTWWDKRSGEKQRRELLIREEFADDNPPEYEPYTDDVASPSTLTLAVPVPGRNRALSTPGPPRSVAQLPRRSHSRSPSNRSPSPSTTTSMRHLPSFSLLTALEFRDVVTSLQHQTPHCLAAFDTPSLNGRHYRSLPSRHRITSPTPHNYWGTEVDPWDNTFNRHMHLNRLDGDTSTENNTQSFEGEIPPIPAISIHSPSSQTSSVDEVHHNTLSRWQRILNTLKETSQTLFPHLQGFSHKSILSIMVAIFATPGVLALTITLPVVASSYGESQHTIVSRPGDHMEGRLIDFEEDGFESVLVAEDELKEEYEMKFNKWLTALQCMLGPVFCAAMLFGRDRAVLWYLVAAAVAGVSTGILVLLFADAGNDPAARLARCFMGFAVAVIWIMAIADEVVSVLKTFGLIFGLSDAIIGLTIFAVGNSLADLVANTSVAAFAPIMGFSACFGGPMLNILLGIGVSGSIIIQESGQDYSLHFSTTLLVSAVGLLVLLVATLVFVPWNGYLLSRRWGLFLLASYVTMMVVNIIVEIKKL
ncbi:hypothetical protein K439DRAFT_1639998 [Ramaria rubella]|nr:hypothetical protein K439DRAFT_1639998 [Ramaria rubella]